MSPATSNARTRSRSKGKERDRHAELAELLNALNAVRTQTMAQIHDLENLVLAALLFEARERDRTAPRTDDAA